MYRGRPTHAEMRKQTDALYRMRREIGSYRLNRVLDQLDEMASAISPRSPILSAALMSPLEFLPVTRFPVDDRTDAFQKLAVEKEKEREVIQSQPYRTTPLICPTPKLKPALVDNKLSGKKPTVYRPLEHQQVVGNLNQNMAVVHRQVNSPRPLYSQQNVAEAVYVQTGYNVGQPQAPAPAAVAPQPQPQPILQQQQQQRVVAPQPNYLQHQQQQRSAPPPRTLPRSQCSPLIPQVVPHPTTAPIHMVPDAPPQFNPQKSPTFRVIIEQEGLGTLQPAPNTRNTTIQKPAPAAPQKYAHSTAPSAHLNSVGMPNDRIAQSHSFRRLMLSLTE